MKRVCFPNKLLFSKATLCSQEFDHELSATNFLHNFGRKQTNKQTKKLIMSANYARPRCAGTLGPLRANRWLYCDMREACVHRRWTISPTFRNSCANEQHRFTPVSQELGTHGVPLCVPLARMERLWDQSRRCPVVITNFL